MQLKNARILLTGASGGLGHELASQLSTAGAALLLAGRDERRLNEVRAALPEEAAVVVADLTSTDGIARTARAAEQFRANVLLTRPLNSLAKPRMRHEDAGNRNGYVRAIARCDS